MEAITRNAEIKREKRRSRLQQQVELRTLLQKYGTDILFSDNFKKTDDYIQHGTMAVSEHCINVAMCSLRISSRMKISCSQKELVRGALLHDYFLYDWHDKDHASIFRLHGFFHPGIALKNADSEYELSRREKDIIKKHMWPLTIVPPRCREAWIVTAADKYCSLLETLHIHKSRDKRLRRRRVKVQFQG